MGSKKAELYQISVGQKRKNLDARAFKALFKRQRTKEDLPDIHGKLEGPDNMSHICDGNGRVISSKPIGGEDASDECCKRLKGNSRRVRIDKATGGDLQKSIGNLRTDSEILGNNVTVDSNYIDDIVAESPKPLGADSLIDTKTDISTRKSFDDSERLPTGCSITENTSTSGSADCMVGPQRVDPAIGHSTMTATNLAESLEMDSISTGDAPNSMSGRRSLGAEVGTGGLEERFSLLSDEDSSKEPSRIIDDTPLFSLSKEKKAKLGIEEIVEIILKKKLGMNVRAAGSEIDDNIKKIRKKCKKLMKKLVRKQEEEVQGLLRTWEEEKVKLEKDHKLESAVTCFIYGQGLVQTSKLKILDDKFAKKMEEHYILKDMQLNSLKEKQLAARDEACQKAGDWLAAGTVNGSRPFGFESENGPECTGSGTHVGPENVVVMFQEHAEDPNPSINLFPQGNEVAPSDISISVLAETTDSGYLAETMSDMETFSSPNDVGVMSLERSSENSVGQLNQLFQSCDITEKIGAANLPVCGEQITDEIRPVEMYQEGSTELTRPVSDDILLHGDPVESNNTSNIGYSIGLPNTEVNHRSEPCESGSGSLPFPGQPLVHSEEMLAFPDHCGLLKQHVSQNEIHQVASAELEDRDTPAAEIQNTSQVEVATSEFGDAVTLVQSNHLIPVTGNGEQLNHLSADAPLVCIRYPPHEIEHQNRDQGTNFSPTVVAGEREDFSHEFISHHNHLDLEQASRISHEQNVDFVRSPDNTVMSEVASTTELPNQSAPQSGIDADHFHGPINNDSEITRSTCVRELQNEIHQVASAELEKLDTPAVEIKNTSQTEVASDAVTLVQSNHAVPVTGNYEQLHHLSVDAPLICNQSAPNGIDNQNGDQVTNFSQIVEARETFSNEFVSQSSENLHHSHLYMGQASRISREQSVEVFVRSPDNTVMAQAVSTIERPNQSVPQLGVDAGLLRGPSYLFVHPTHPVTSWNSTPSLVAEPLQNELEKLLKEAERLEKIYEDSVSQLKSACEKEIQEIISQICTKYDKKLQVAEANFRFKKNELEKSKNLVLMNTKLAAAFRSKFQFRPLQLQQVFTSSFEQHLHQPSLPPSMRISPLASASRPPPSQQTLAPSAEALNQLHMLPPVRSSPVAIRNATASPPIQSIQRAGPVLLGTSARPLVIASHTPAAHPGIAEIRSRAPHLQPFRLAAAPSMAHSSFSAIPQQHSQPVFPPQLVATTRPAPCPPRLPQLIPNHVPQNAHEPQSRQQFHLNQSESPIDLLRDMNCHALMNRNVPPLADVDSKVLSLEPSNLVTLGNIQGNPASSAVDTDIICLSDE